MIAVGTKPNLSELKFFQISEMRKVTGQHAYFVRISKSAEKHINNSVTCLQDTEFGPNVIEREILPTHWQSRLSEAPTIALRPASKNRPKNWTN